MKTLDFQSIVSKVGLGVIAFSGPALCAEALAESRDPTSPHALFVAETNVTNSEALKPYRDQVEATFRPYGGRFLVRGGPVASLEGDSPKGRFVIIEFDSVEKARAWYESSAYQKLKPIRLGAATSRVLILETTPQRSE